MPKISFKLNGKTETLDTRLDQRLLDILRVTYRLTGSKEGCGEGECGACSVLIDGKLTNSCLVPLGSIDGTEIITIEGYRQSEGFKYLKEAFIKEGASQCGICTPGMIMAAAYLLKHNPNPSEDEIRHGLAGNLCRCTGYNMIIKAIKRASKAGEDVWKI